MADAPDTPNTARKTLDEIAASIIETPPPGGAGEVAADVSGGGDNAQRADRKVPPGSDGRPDQPIEEDHEDSEDLASPTGTQDEGGSPDNLPDDEDNSSTDGEVEDDDPLFSDLFDTPQERVSDDAEEPLDTSKLGDDVVLSVTVDEVEQQVTLGELKKRYAGEGAIEKRLQEATETRKTAVEDYQKSRQLTEAMLREFGQALFRRTVPYPDDTLLEVDVTAYTRQKNMYDQETAALSQAHNQLHGMMSQIDQLNQEATQAQRRAAAAELRKIMPVFNDPVRGPKVREAILETASELGFSREEISASTDPRVFRALALAARELKRGKGPKVSKQQETSRSLKAKGTRNRKPATTAQRKEREIFKQARASGSVDDVAATLIQRPPRRGRR